MSDLIEWKIAMGSMIHLVVLSGVIVWIAWRMSKQLTNVERKQDELLEHLRKKP